MLKRILLFALVSIITVMVQAQSLEGKWKSEQLDKDGSICISLLFSKSEVDMKVAGSKSDPDFGTISLSLSLPCSYLRDGDSLFVTPQKEKAKVNLDKLEFKGELTDSLEANPEIGEFVKALIVGTLDSKKDDLMKEFPLGVGLKIVSHTDSSISIRDEKGKELLFTRVKEE